VNAGAHPLGAPERTAPPLLPRLAALVVLLMAAVLWVDVLFRERLLDLIGSSGYSTTAGVVISAVAVPVAAGLWLRAAWAWWTGLVAAVWQLLSHLLYIVVATASGGTVGALGWLIALLLVVFLIVLLLPATRDACLQR
jgi:hypothetical protein